MRRIFINALLIGSMSLSSVALAHGPMMFSDAPRTTQGMMGYVEERMIGEELHEEMEELMEKMMAGNMDESEANKITEFMNQYPGAGSMMMTRMLNQGAWGYGMGPWMMQGIWSGNFSFWALFITLGVVVWFLVGVLLVVWLWKLINKK